MNRVVNLNKLPVAKEVEPEKSIRKSTTLLVQSLILENVGLQKEVIDKEYSLVSYRLAVTVVSILAGILGSILIVIFITS